MKTRYKEQRIEIAERFEQLLELLGVSTADLCRVANVPDKYIDFCDGTGSDAGTIPEREMKKICDTWEISFEWLLNGVGEPFKDKKINLPQHYYNVFEQQNNGLYKHIKSFKKRVNAIAHIRSLKEENPHLEYALIETDKEIEVYKQIKL